jgi:hypothetical protein
VSASRLDAVGGLTQSRQNAADGVDPATVPARTSGCTVVRSIRLERRAAACSQAPACLGRGTLKRELHQARFIAVLPNRAEHSVWAELFLCTMPGERYFHRANCPVV